MARDMRHLDYTELRDIMGEQPYRLLFATVSGAHLYGFPSRDSDVDLRGVHVLPAAEVVGLRNGPETLDRTWFENEAEVDLVTHDLAKFARLMLRRRPRRRPSMARWRGRRGSGLRRMWPGCAPLSTRRRRSRIFRTGRPPSRR
jgi:RNA repair pathway DNA polymerase beta family